MSFEYQRSHALKKDTVASIEEQNPLEGALAEVLCQGARKCDCGSRRSQIGRAVEAYQEQRDGEGRQRLLRHGYVPKRKVQLGIGGIEVRIRWIKDRGTGEGSEDVIRFRTCLVPPCLRRSFI